MSARYWQFWESNWWPDFPSSAAQAEYFFKARYGIEPDGVIAVDQSMVRQLLKVTGPVQVPGFDEVVEAGNVQERLEFHVHRADTPDPVRKSFVTALFGAVVGQSMHLPRDRMPDLSSALYDGFRAQRLQMWSRDDGVQQALTTLHWDGRLLASSSDYLQVVSTNVSANKVNRDIEQVWDYAVTHRSGELTSAELTLRIRNTRTSDDPWPYETAAYRDYLRVYVPSGARLVSAAGLESVPETLNECGRTAFAGLVTVKPREQREIRFTYVLPDPGSVEPYALTVQAQPGSGPVDLSVTLAGDVSGTSRGALEESTRFRVQSTGIERSPWRRIGESTAVPEIPCAVHSAPRDEKPP